MNMLEFNTAETNGYSYVTYTAKQSDYLLDYIQTLSEEADKLFDLNTKRWKIKTDRISVFSKRFDQKILCSNLKFPPFKYQKEAIKFCLRQNNSIINLPCGAGKTYIAIGIASELEKRNKVKPPYLVVAKSSLKFQWAEEIRKFSNYHPMILKTYIEATGSLQAKINRERNIIKALLSDAIANRLLIVEKEDKIKELERRAQENFEAQFDPQHDFYILNYETLNDKRVRNILKEQNLSYIFCDEIHLIKDDTTLKSQYLRELNNIKYKFGGTATLIKKNPLDIFGIFSFLQPSLFPKKTRFTEQYLKINHYGRPIGSKNEQCLHDMIYPYLFIRTKAEIDHQLPELVPPIIKYCSLTPKQEEMTKKLLSEIELLQKKEKDIGVALFDQADLTEITGHIMARQTIAQQLCDHEDLLRSSESCLAKKYITHSPSNKLALLLEILEEILAAGEKVCIYTKYLKMQEIILKNLYKLASNKNSIFNDIKIAYVNGSMDAAMRFEEVYAKFRDNDAYKILLCSEAANEGLNLSNCKYLIEYDLADSFAGQTQRHGRIERADSVHSKVFVYQLIAKNSYDEIAQKIISKKEKYAKQIIY